MSLKPYKCKECGHEKQLDTNHYGECYSFGRYNTCPKCPPYKKYSEYGGSTTWLFNGELPKDAWIPDKWNKTIIKIKNK